MRAEIISVGTEILMGQIVDTNAAWIAQQLPALGIDLYFVSVVGDNPGRLGDTLQRALGRSDIVIMTGGLGPTEDDVTRETISDVMGEPMEALPERVEALRQWFAGRGVVMPERNIKQATIIRSGRILENPIGTAPGWWVERDGRIIVTMPGVPYEMKRMWREEVMPLLTPRTDGAVIFSRLLKVIGMGESSVEEKIRELIHSSNPSIGTYAKNDGIHLRVTAKSPTRDEAEKLVMTMEGQIRQILGKNIYGVDEETLPEAIGHLLREKGLTIAAAESCTGGLFSSQLTDVAGSSDYYQGGMITYSAEAKVALGVDPEIIDIHGTVTIETTIAMARAVRARFGVDIGVAITGVAGTEIVEGKAPGSYNIAIDYPGSLQTVSGQARGPREEVKHRVALAALNLLWQCARQDGVSA